MDATELRQAGNRALAKRDYEAAKAAFARLIDQKPESPDGYIGLARVLERLGDFHAIVRTLEPVAAALDLPSLHKALADAYRVLSNRGDMASVNRAIQHYEAVGKKRADPIALFYLGELYREHKKDFATALTFLRMSWEADPGSRQVYEAAMQCLKRLGVSEEVLKLETEWGPMIRD